MNKKRLWIIGSVAVGVIIILLIVIPLLSRIGKINVKILASPKDSTVLMDGQPASLGDIWITPGTHSFKVSHQYFFEATKTIDTKTIEAEKTIYIILEPDGEKGLQWLKDHPDDQAIREAFGSQRAEEIQTDIPKEFPIVDKLPQETINYKIDYTTYDASNKKLYLTITLNAILNRPSQLAQYKADLKTYQAEALKFLTDNGVNLDNVVITYEPDPNQ